MEPSAASHEAPSHPQIQPGKEPPPKLQRGCRRSVPCRLGGPGPCSLPAGGRSGALPRAWLTDSSQHLPASHSGRPLASCEPRATNHLFIPPFPSMRRPVPPIRQRSRPMRAWVQGPRGGQALSPTPQKEPPGLSSLITLGLPGGWGILLWHRPRGWPPDLPHVGQALPWLWALTVSPSQPGPWPSGQEAGRSGVPLLLGNSWGGGGSPAEQQLTHRPAPRPPGRLGGPHGPWCPLPTGWSGGDWGPSWQARTFKSELSDSLPAGSLWSQSEDLGPRVAAQGGPGVHSMAPLSCPALLDIEPVHSSSLRQSGGLCLEGGL